MSKVTIAHLSDPHFGTVEPHVLRGLQDSLRELRPDLVLMSGDITQRARREQFKAAREFSQALKPLPFFAVPGNHDIPLFNLWGRFTHPYRGFHRYFQAKRETDLRLGGVRVVGLNSTSRWRHVQGKLDIARVRESFFSGWDDSQIRVAMVHHPLDCAKNIDDKNRLRGREEATALFKEAQIDLVLSGHVHDPFVAVEQSMILCVAGTCLSRRTRLDAPNSYHAIDIDPTAKRITITRMDIAGDNRFHPRKDWIKKFEFRAGEGWVSGGSPQ